VALDVVMTGYVILVVSVLVRRLGRLVPWA
jgi:hypothetical protein